MKNPWVAGLLSFLIPGLGQLYLKEKAKGFSILCIAVGILIALATSRSLFSFILIGPLYLFVIIPATVDAYQTAAGKPRTFKGESVLYVVVMLLVVGPFAIPLLWQNHKFSRPVKIILTVLVTAIALVAVVALKGMASFFDGVITIT